MGSRPDDVLMGVPRVPPSPEISYEEQRFQDYLKAYQTTGRPPLPVPETPAGAEERLALGLPPLFEPYVVNDQVQPQASTSSAVYQTLEEVPQTQTFVATRMDSEPGEAKSGVFYQTIVMQKQYYHFSPEELRVQAYRTGNKVGANPVPAVTTATPAATTPAAVTVSPTRSNSSMTNGTSEDYQSISCKPSYAQHSFEELRVAYMLLGREATSEEIVHENHRIRLTV
ncbi:hypothetical protein EIP91_011945 [Steccherinum ochraceum]|uniref:Uncharacterized protein n=1 Tax=Steccherinum ochraceum TaxID=92696 RepID=A0A4R0RQS0_9APHY|nr:hypothetical protein EIP91_011945 [Steccherinum ochraceum]